MSLFDPISDMAYHVLVHNLDEFRKTIISSFLTENCSSSIIMIDTDKIPPNRIKDFTNFQKNRVFYFLAET